MLTNLFFFFGQLYWDKPTYRKYTNLKSTVVFRNMHIKKKKRNMHICMAATTRAVKQRRASYSSQAQSSCHLFLCSLWTKNGTWIFQWLEKVQRRIFVTWKLHEMQISLSIHKRGHLPSFPHCLEWVLHLQTWVAGCCTDRIPLQSLEQFLSDPLQKKSADPCYRASHHPESSP